MAYRGFQIILDGVCSVASELIKMDDWGVDVVMTASQKGLGTPPGLSILVASTRAVKVYPPENVLLTNY
jgi:alanine-glyoxylate transaminase / serine-glyoxylate transaminase / serine-pyruvate transaminase